MKRVFSWALLLFLAGCQTTQQDSVATDEMNPISSSVEETTASSKEEPTEETLNSSAVSAVDKQPEATPWNQEDIWNRIGMQLNMPIPEQKKVDYYRNWYIKHPNHLRAVSQRAESFLYLIVEEIENRHLPLELALLPIVESSFDPFAYSHGSAAGLWQFVPGTGRMYGLDQNYWYDGRRDVKAATSAALDYLESLNKRFEGNWNHAIAAYNSGGGRVSRAIRKNVNAGKPTDFFSLDLPKETSGYVPKLLALADIVKNQEKYGVAIPPIANKQVVEQVDPGEQLDIAVAAAYAGMTVGDLQKLNPAYNQWATPPEGPHYFLLPLERTDVFAAKAEENRGKGVRVVRYKVKSGDSLSVIAKKHKTTSDTIRTVNNLNGSFIRAGQHLMIPVSSKGDDAYVFSAQNRLQKTQSVARGKYKVTHTVSKGDSLWTIARKHKVSHQSLAKWNGMGPRDTLRIGQKLVIWKNGSEGSIIRTVHYKVRNGDTLSGIASKFRVKTADIVKWNNLNKSRYIKPGQQIKLYVDVTKVSV
ncbi:LysM peptidoglycan-binding domain-containing protein [Vibrio hannami]|uniref:LysM peptidoglycan-binding domain-containing protein n=1 Tax=Vibrio hannami TaxID=2717094 RepID=UPI00240F61FA|nr:LysM peptidoglycan-binding domain-containing protein [Vibrio hannami]MDG3088850.1 LysM peptidoglycan-binding domain-containing protein [Vibrio hannami]